MTDIRARELELGRRIVAYVEAGPPRAATPASTLDATIYRDPARHDAELALMAARPVAVAAASEVAEPGSFLTTTLGRTPVLVSRDRNGELHAMVNACIHRGATVETRVSGTARVLSCGFHGWSYDLDGSLRAVADAPLVSAEPCQGRMRQLVAEERHGIVWVTVRPDPDRDPTVAAWLGDDLDGLLDGLGLGDMVLHESIDYDLGCNWKLLTDGFLEIYHLKYLHRDSIAPYFPANTNLLDRFGEHVVTMLPKSRLVRDLADQPEDQWQVWSGLTMAVVLVPGTVIQWQAGHVELFSLRPDPDQPNRSRCRLSMLVPRSRAADTELWDRNWKRVCETIPNEDFAAAEDVQHNVDVGAADTLTIGANEHLLLDHLETLDRLMAARG